MFHNSFEKSVVQKCEKISSNFENEYISDFEIAEEYLLYYSRTGNLDKLKELFKFIKKEKTKININYKGTQKSNKGWTALHLASYFGNYDVVEFLLNENCDINVLNENGDTPLHKAAFIGRIDIVTLLLKKNADVFIKNDDFKLAKDITKNESVFALLDQVEEFDLKKREETFILSAKNNDINKMKELLNSKYPIDVNCQDLAGNTALHYAASRENKEVINFLLQQNNIDTSIKNNKSLISASLAHNISLKKLLLDFKKPKLSNLHKRVNKFEGFLYRRNKFRVWRRVWCVLYKGILSFYNSKEDALNWSKKRDNIYLESAIIEANDYSSCITIYFNKKYKLNLQVPNTLDSNKNKYNLIRQKWINAIQDHIDYSKNFIKQGFKIDYDSEENLDDLMPTNFLQNLLNTAQAHQAILNRHIHGLKQFMNEDLKLIQAQLPESITFENSTIIMNILKKFWPTLTFHLSFIQESSSNTSRTLQHCLNLMYKQDKLRQIQLKQKNDKIKKLEETVQILAQQQHDFEKSVKVTKNSSDNFDETSTDCEEYFDAFDDEETNFESEIKKSASDFDLHESEEFQILHDLKQCTTQRDKLPAKMITRADIALWSILKNCIGKELSKITMPVVFNEPLSFLQRLTENVAYIDILNLANETNDPVERIELITAYIVACLSNNWLRLNKPFNPLLGETYEYKDGKNVFSICEQVSHHPPISAYHVENDSFKRFGSICPKLKFWGKSIEIQPEGLNTTLLKKPNEVYTWSNVNCSIHNIIVGKLWFEHFGKLEIICSSTNLKAVLNFKKAGWTGKNLNCLDGFIINMNTNNKLKYFYGNWTHYLKIVDLVHYEKYILENQNFKIPEKYEINSKSFVNNNVKCDNSIKCEKLNDSLTNSKNLELQKKSNGKNLKNDQLTKSESSNFFDIPNSKLLWLVEPKLESSHDYYEFNKFTFKLNEFNEKEQFELPRTDSRFRPDIRYLELGDLDVAADEKNRLEEKQRTRCKEIKKSNINYCPMWFEFKKNEYTNELDWIFTGKYLERQFNNCPEIF